MNRSQEVNFLKFIKLLSDNDCLQHVILIGSWAEYVYKEAQLVHGLEPNIVTRDIDFLIKNIRKPAEPKSITALAREAGYRIESDILYNTTKIQSGADLEIEFIVNQMGSGDTSVIKTNLGVNAQALRNMDILSKHSIKTNLFGFDITVPIPEAYVLHKMLINAERKEKSTKDKFSILNLYKFIDKGIFLSLFEELSPKAQRKVHTFIQDNKLNDISQTPTIRLRR